MSYVLETRTTFSSDAAERCPVCGLTLIRAIEPYAVPQIYECFNHDLYYYLETVAGPESGAGELGYWTES